MKKGLPKKELTPDRYIFDDLLYLIWNIARLDVQKPPVMEYLFEAIKSPHWDNKQAMLNLFPLAEQFGITLQDPRFEKECFKDSYPEDYESLIRETENELANQTKKPSAGIDLFFDNGKALEVRKKILLDEREDMTMDDIKALVSDLTLAQHSLLEGIWFKIRPDDETRQKILRFLDAYLTNFINDKLFGKPQDFSTSPSFVRLQNFYTAERHIHYGSFELISKRDSFGDRLVINGPTCKFPEFLYIHYLLAIEKLGYIKIRGLGTCGGAFTHGDTPEWEAHLTIQPSFSSLGVGLNTPLPPGWAPGIKINKKQDTCTLYLENSGDLWREPKDRYCYQMMESKERLNIIKMLMNNPTGKFVPTKSLASGLGRDAKYIRSDIGKMNSISQNRLELKLIDSKQGSGYRINPKIKILPG